MLYLHGFWGRELLSNPSTFGALVFCSIRARQRRALAALKPDLIFSDWHLFTFRANCEKQQDIKRAVRMRVLGVDPGLRNMGWGIIEVSGSRIAHVANGICHSKGSDLALRLLSLHDQLTDVVSKWAPDTAAVEQTFVNKDAVATLKLGQARAVALLVPAQAGLPVAEYAPNKVKKTVVGVGHAEKQQIDHMVRLQLPGVEISGADAADALAIALCHAHYARASDRLSQAIAGAVA